jgi:hypothetical protein
LTRPLGRKAGIGLKDFPLIEDAAQISAQMRAAQVRREMVEVLAEEPRAWQVNQGSLSHEDPDHWLLYKRDYNIWDSVKEPRLMNKDLSEVVVCESAFPFSAREKRREISIHSVQTH